MARHKKGASGSLPANPMDGVKDVPVVVKMSKREADMATALASFRGVSRSELIRQLLAREMEVDNTAFMAARAKARTTQR
jgi:hypothetical protein